MNQPKAVIFDIYGTLFDVEGHCEIDRETQWHALHGEFFGSAPDMTLEHLAERCRHIVSEDHSVAHAFGVPHSEVVWADIMKQAFPVFANLAPDRHDDFLYRHMQLLRSVRLAPKAPLVLAECRRLGVLLGIVSNAQPYTLRELAVSMEKSGMNSEIFEKDLCFWSFENGFSKPDPHVFRTLAFRLLRRGIRPEETLIVGDRLDNDVEPARAQGFQTWWLNESDEGDWTALIHARFPQLDASQQTP